MESSHKCLQFFSMKCVILDSPDTYFLLLTFVINMVQVGQLFIGSDVPSALIFMVVCRAYF
jgi:hypothetical protein